MFCYGLKILPGIKQTPKDNVVVIKKKLCFPFYRQYQSVNRNLKQWTCFCVSSCLFSKEHNW